MLMLMKMIRKRLKAQLKKNSLILTRKSTKRNKDLIQKAGHANCPAFSIHEFCKNPKRIPKETRRNICLINLHSCTFRHYKNNALQKKSVVFIF